MGADQLHRWLRFVDHHPKHPRRCGNIRVEAWEAARPPRRASAATPPCASTRLHCFRPWKPSLCFDLVVACLDLVVACLLNLPSTLRQIPTIMMFSKDLNVCTMVVAKNNSYNLVALRDSIMSYAQHGHRSFEWRVRRLKSDEPFSHRAPVLVPSSSDWGRALLSH